jgi:predicted nucleic acid-binding protein
MKLFLDNCCLNRPMDDQSQHRVSIETTAVLEILRRIEDGLHQLLASSYLLIEIRKNPDIEHQTEVLNGLRRLATIARGTVAIETRARHLESLGLRTFDALHVAAAEAVNADCLLTTDDRLLNFGQRNATVLAVRIANPIAWLKEQNP